MGKKNKKRTQQKQISRKKEQKEKSLIEDKKTPSTPDYSPLLIPKEEKIQNEPIHNKNPQKKVPPLLDTININQNPKESPPTPTKLKSQKTKNKPYTGKQPQTESQNQKKKDPKIQEKTQKNQIIPEPNTPEKCLDLILKEKYNSSSSLQQPTFQFQLLKQFLQKLFDLKENIHPQQQQQQNIQTIYQQFDNFHLYQIQQLFMDIKQIQDFILNKQLDIDFKEFLYHIHSELNPILKSQTFSHFISTQANYSIYEFLNSPYKSFLSPNEYPDLSLLKYQIQSMGEFSILQQLEQQLQYLQTQNISYEQKNCSKIYIESQLHALDIKNNDLCLQWLQNNSEKIGDEVQYMPLFFKNKDEQRTLILILQIFKQLQFPQEKFDSYYLYFKNSHTNQQNQLENIKKWLDNSEDFSVLQEEFFNIVNRGQKWDLFLRNLNDEFKKFHPNLSSQFQFNKKLLINLYASCCSRTKKLKIYQQLIKSTPIPLLHNKIPLKTSNNSANKRDMGSIDSLKEVNDMAFIFTEDSIGIVSFGIGNCALNQTGKSQLLNYLFKTNFIECDNSPLSYQTIDIDFDQSFKPTRNLTIADCCGLMQPKILKSVLLYFNYVMVHIDFKEFSHLQNDIELILKETHINQKKKGQLKIIFLIRDTPKNIFINTNNNNNINNNINNNFNNNILQLTKQKYKNISQLCKNMQINLFNGSTNFVENMLDSNNISIIMIPDQNQLQKEEKKNLLSDIQDHIYSELNQIYKTCNSQNSSKFLLNQNKMYELIKNLSQIYNQKVNFDERHINQIKQCLDIIKANKKDFFNKDFLPFRQYNKELSELNHQKKKLQDPQKILNLQKKIDHLSHQIRSQKPSEILKLFCDGILKNQNWYELLILLSLEINKISQNQLLYLKNEKDNLLSQNQKLDQKIAEIKDEKLQVEILLQKKQDLEKELKNIQEMVQNQTFSIEILWRELLYYYELNPSSRHDFIIDPLENLQQSLEYGESFEIIDGDNMNLNMQSLNILSEKMKDNKIFPLAIFGPQSSGKSTLLNYLFGCQFSTSTGRCTRGVYGSFVKINSMPFDYILILDTEGLQDPDKPNDHFDKTIILFILAMTQLSVINFKGEINQSMKNLIEICIYSLQKIKMNRTHNGECFLVFNQNPNSKDISAFQDQVNTMQKKILGANPDAIIEANLIAKKENLLALGSAFDVQSQSKQDYKDQIWNDWEQRLPSDNFAQQCNKLYQMLMQNTTKIKTDWNFKQWVKIASDMWHFIDDNYYLVRASSIQELQLDHKLSIAVQNIINDNYNIDTQKTFKSYIEEYEHEDNNNNVKLENMYCEELRLAQNDILNKNLKKQRRLIRGATEKLEQLCELDSIPMHMQNKYQDLLTCEIDNVFKDIDFKIKKYFVRLNQNNLVSQGINTIFEKIQEQSKQIPLEQIKEFVEDTYKIKFADIYQLEQDAKYKDYLKEWAEVKFQTIWQQIIKEMYVKLDLEKMYKFIFQKVQDYSENKQIDLNPFNNHIDQAKQILMINGNFNQISDQQIEQVVDFFIKSIVNSEYKQIFTGRKDVSDKFQLNLDVKFRQLEKRSQFLNLREQLEIDVIVRYIEQQDLLDSINYYKIASFIEQQTLKINYIWDKKQVFESIKTTLKNFFFNQGFQINQVVFDQLQKIYSKWMLSEEKRVEMVLVLLSQFLEFQKLKPIIHQKYPNLNSNPPSQQYSEPEIVYHCKQCKAQKKEPCDYYEKVYHSTVQIQALFCYSCQSFKDSYCQNTVTHFEFNEKIHIQSGDVRYICHVCKEQYRINSTSYKPCDKVSKHYDSCQKINAFRCLDCNSISRTDCCNIKNIKHQSEKIILGNEDLEKEALLCQNKSALQPIFNSDIFNIHELNKSFSGWHANLDQKIKEEQFSYSDYSQVQSETQNRKKHLNYLQTQSFDKILFQNGEEVLVKQKSHNNQRTTTHESLNNQIQDALQYLQNPTFYLYNNNRKRFTLSFSTLAQQTLYWQKILTTIIEKIKENLAIKNHNQNFKSQDLDSQDQRDHSIAEFSKITMDCSIQQIKIIIEEINKDLEYFNLQISSQGEQLLLFFGLCINWKILCFQYKQVQEDPIKIFETKKEDWQKQFVARITNDHKSQTEVLVQKTLDDIITYYKSQDADQEIQTINAHFTDQYLQQQFNQKKITQITEQSIFIQQENTKENVENTVLKYIESPTPFLQETFNNLWYSETTPQIDQANTNFKKKINKKLLEIKNCIEMISYKFKEETHLKPEDYPDRLFIAENAYLDQFLKLDDEEKRTLLDKICYQFMHQILQGVKINKDSTFQDQETNFIFKLNQQTLKRNFEIQLPNMDFFQFIQWNDSDKKARQIAMPYYFVQFLLQKVQEKEASNDQFLNENDLLLFEKMKSCQKNCIGCIQQCKCCGKKCDEVNFELQHQHSCSRHFVRGFKGVQMQNTLSNYSCDEIPFQARIKIVEKVKNISVVKTWQEIVSQNYPEWRYQGNQNLLPLEQGDVDIKKAWEKYSQSVCTFYKLYNDNKDLKVKTDQSIHNILCLDDSGSMGGQKWEQAKQAALQYLQNLDNSMEFKTKKITLIQFNSNSKIVYGQTGPEDINIQKARGSLQYQGGGTQFGPPISDALRQIQKNPNFDVHNIIFFTDGCAGYPAGEMSTLKSLNYNNNHLYMRIMFHYCTIAGNDQVLQQISNNFASPGKKLNNLKIENLADAFLEILDAVEHQVTI